MGNNFDIKDSGERTTFDSGAQRDRGGEKSRPDLISPFFAERLGWHMMRGARKYQAWNYCKGMPNSEYWASLNRHVQCAAMGMTDEDHLAAIAFNVMGLMHNQAMFERGLLDPKYNDWPVDWAALTGANKLQENTNGTGPGDNPPR